MRRAVALVFAVWTASACAVNGTAAAPTAAPSPTAEPVTISEPAPIVADPPAGGPLQFRQGPDAASSSGRAVPPTAPPTAEAIRAVSILTPHVAVRPAAYAVDPMPTRAATAAELNDLRNPLGQWVDSFIAMLERSRRPQGVDTALDLRNMFTDQRLSTIALRSLTPGNIYGQPTLTGAGWTLDGGVMRAWGSPAYADITVNAVDHGASDVALQWRLRVLTVGFWFRVMDLREPGAGTWVLGTAPRYSALELETEMSTAVAWYLNSESYSSYQRTSAARFFADAPFFHARTAAIEELNQLYAADRFRERYFENVSASIERFEPAWFGGDGVVTATVTGRMVETRNNGTQVTTSFVQRLKFLRTPDSWTPIDAQNDDGTWASGGNLALAEVARPHG